MFQVTPATAVYYLLAAQRVEALPREPRLRRATGMLQRLSHVFGDHGEIIEQVAAHALTSLVIPDRVKPEFRFLSQQTNLPALPRSRGLDDFGRQADETVARLVDLA